MYRTQLATMATQHLQFQSGFSCKLSKLSIPWTKLVQSISFLEYSVNDFLTP